MTFIFDQVMDRSHTDSAKWELYGPDVLPLWIADMDFATAPVITEALHQRISHGIYGYTQPGKDLEQLIVDRCRERYQWEIQAEWIVWLPNLVSALHIATRAYTTSDESVIAPVPVYHHFLIAPKNADRELVQLNWTDRDGVPVLDLEELDARLARQESKEPRLLLLCNPHNPNGRVLSQAELQELEQFCQKHNLIICSDEIHCDLILDKEVRHTPFASLSDFAREHTVTLMSASKTFNLAGFASAYAIIPNAELRARFQQVRDGIVPPPDMLGFIAAKAAYSEGGDWHEALLEYLRGNHDYLLQAINAIPGLTMKPLQGTYLAWIDTSALGLDDPQAFFLEAGVGLNAGAVFGDKDYVRLNFACPRSVLEEAVGRMAAAIAARG
ncbi:MalY/PatB family protein [Parendozoicomonas haliclonae]|uniref:cysteine-S-conjugate beta-lyase n=1 Tax=Parendozoicomonas haliclonae TaxID=1960125 RepID=A0A1X7AK86_9GAMM|nr:PatB family C-S lyase [Parendozoicomonas haliclonae]SMA47521.1 Cystathionine beta-lyase PatB [Parendozoicomonas haliclonae]